MASHAETPLSVASFPGPIIVLSCNPSNPAILCIHINLHDSVPAPLALLRSRAIGGKGGLLGSVWRLVCLVVWAQSRRCEAVVTLLFNTSEGQPSDSLKCSVLKMAQVVW